MTRIAKRCMAVLTGLHAQGGLRISRERLAGICECSIRSIFNAMRELESYKWITVSGGGNNTPGSISVLNDIDWKFADVRRIADVRPKFADDSSNFAGDPLRIRAKEFKKEKKDPPSPSRSVENPTWREIEAFAIENDLQLCSGADIESAMEQMRRAASGAQPGGDKSGVYRPNLSPSHPPNCVPLAEMASASISGEVATSLPPPIRKHPHAEARGQPWNAVIVSLASSKSMERGFG